MNARTQGCERYADWLPFLDDLSAEERRDVLRHTEGCPSCRKQLGEVRAILRGLARRDATGHLEGDLLTRFAVHRAHPAQPDYDGRRLAWPELAAIEAHVRACARCRDAVDRAIAEYRSMEAAFREQGLGDLELGARRMPEVRPLRRALRIRRPALYPAAALALAASLVLVWVSPFLRGSAHDFYRLAAVGDYQVVVTRGGSSLLDQAYSDFRERRYDAAIAKLERVIAAQPDDPGVAEARLTAAVAYLATARRGFLGRFERVDTVRVAAAIRHLDAAEASGVTAIRDEAMWYRGMAMLLGSDPAAALEVFARVAAAGGTRAPAARRLLAELDALGA
jgi:predicted anti-sigma-YlaC factor YlaD